MSAQDGAGVWTATHLHGRMGGSPDKGGWGAHRHNGVAGEALSTGRFLGL